MRTRGYKTSWMACLFAITIAGAGLTAHASAATNGKTPVVAELFTSEGCSDCPPADALLRRLNRSQPVPGARIIALSEHVDYWDGLGWKDPYSAHQFTRRETHYSRLLGSHVYTPQMVIDGQRVFVGSRAQHARQAIARASESRKANVELRVDAGRTDAVAVDVRVNDFPTGHDAPVTVWLAVTQNNLTDRVGRGENSGRRLSHTAVVRRMQRIARIGTDAGTGFHKREQVRLNPAWKRRDLRVVIFVQNGESGRILGAAESKL